MSSGWFLGAVCAAALSLGVVSASVAQTTRGQDDGTIRYVVRSGDTLYDLAQTNFVRVSDYRSVQRLNRVANPRRMAVGRTLVIPTDLLKSEPIQARIVSFRGDVQLSGGTLATGAALGEGAVISTGANAFLRFSLPDGGHVTIPSQSRVRVARLRRIILNGAIDHELSVETGRAESRAAPVLPAGRFRVRTPVSVSAVRGTDFRVAYVPAREAGSTEVLEGVVGVSDADLSDEVRVSAREAAAEREGVIRIVPLLPAPALAQPDKPQTETDLSFAVTPQTGAAAYRGRMATDAGFIDSFLETDSNIGASTLAFPAVEDGVYFLRLTALSEEGVEGVPTAYSFVRLSNRLGGLAASVDGVAWDRRYKFRWEAQGAGVPVFRFQLRRVDGEAETVVVDEADLAASELTLTGLPSGVYNWRVRAGRSGFGMHVETWSDPQELRIGR